MIDRTLRVEGVSAGYGSGTVLEGVSLSALAGEVVALLGPNGAGKSTLIRCLSATLAPTSGVVSLGGETLLRLSRAEVARRIAVVPQFEEFVFEFTVRQMVEMGRYPHGDTGLERVDAAIAECGLKNLAGRPVTELSGGERQRVLIARALAQDPDVFLFDEPTTHLDVGHQVALFRRVAELGASGRTVVAALHDLNLASALAARAVLLDRGRVVFDGPTRELLLSDTVERVYGAGFTRQTDHAGRVFLQPEFGC